MTAASHPVAFGQTAPSVMRSILRARVGTLAGCAMLFLASCPIASNDPLPNFGAPCKVSDGACVREHVCQPVRPDDDNADAFGVCVPVATYGVCDATQPVTHAPGRLGKERQADSTAIQTVGNLNLIDEVRTITGDLQVFQPGPDGTDLSNLCAFRDLQAIGGTLAIGDSDITTLDGLQSLTSVGRGVFLFDNPSLSNLDGLLHLTDLGTAALGDGRAVHVVVVGNGSLTDDVVDDFVHGLEARLTQGTALVSVACGNQGRACTGADDALLRTLIANGIFSDVLSP